MVRPSFLSVLTMELQKLQSECLFCKVTHSSISFPEPTCLLVSTKTRSSGIINFQSPRFQEFLFHSACVPWFTWRPETKSTWMHSTKAFNMHWKNQESLNLALKEKQYHILKANDTWDLGMRLLIIPELCVLMLTKRHVGSGNKIIDYPRTPCLGTDQKTCGPWEQDWMLQPF